MEYNLNQGQKKAADAFFEFLFDDNRKEFIISGPAGVGKTYLMSYIIDTTMSRYYDACKLIGMNPQYTQVHMTATTNKAAEVLGLATGRPTSTVHSFLNLKVQEDFTSGVSKLIKTNGWKVHENIILFIDEASMIDKELYKIIQEGTHNCKIVYVGDHNQLAPVAEDLSPVYKQNSPFFELTQPMRNAGQPALMAICQQLRETVETLRFNPISLVPGVIDRLSGEEMEALINQQFKSQNPNERILAYTNKRVIQYNSHIRTIRGLPDTYQVGELLINNSAIKLGSRAKMLSVEQGVEIINHDGFGSMSITSQVDLAVEFLDIKSDMGEYYTHVPVPTDRDHYNKLLKYFKGIKNFERYYYMKGAFPDLRQRDAATVHKAQGSTYDAVYIDLSNIGTCNAINQVARMLYVAFSRARNRIYLYGDLPAKYGGVSG